MQQLLARRTEAVTGGAEPVGWKVGLNAPAAQQLFDLDGPIVGSLLSDTNLAPMQPIAIGGWAKPALEVEIAIRVGADGQVAALGPALELVDLGDFFGEIGQVLATNICHRGVVFGEETTGPGLDDSVAELEVEVRSPDGAVRAVGTLAEPPAVTLETVRRFLEAHGATLSAGDRIIAGSIITPMPIAVGEDVTVTFGPLGTLTARFR
jgi:2-keto-4-pentenoate hydratase